jgi:hypothetical protein
LIDHFDTDLSKTTMILHLEYPDLSQFPRHEIIGSIWHFFEPIHRLPVRDDGLTGYLWSYFDFNLLVVNFCRYFGATSYNATATQPKDSRHNLFR